MRAFLKAAALALAVTFVATRCSPPWRHSPGCVKGGDLGACRYARLVPVGTGSSP